MRAPNLLFFILLVIGPTGWKSAFAQFDELARRIPASANALVLFNAEKVYASPIALQHNWQAEHTKAFVDGLVTMPPDTTHYILASQLDFEFMQPLWDVALLDMNESRQLPEIARKVNGKLDQVGTYQAVELPSDAYVIRFGNTSYGARAPANRQNIGRWVRRTDTQQGPAVSAYLDEALGFAQDVGTPVIMALDLEDVVTSADAAAHLQDSPTVKQRNVDADALAKSLAGLRGVTLGITFGKNVYGKIKIDFASDVSSMESIAKPLLLEVLGNQGAMIEDFESWKVAAKGNQVTLGGRLSESGSRRIFSLMDAPLSFLHPKEEQSQPQAKFEAQASKRYYDSVVSLLDDLQGKKGTASHLNMYGVWFDRYAAKISELPILGVDPELLDYGAWMEAQFRNAAMAVKSKGMRSRVRQVNANANLSGSNNRAAAYNGFAYNYSSGYRYGRYGGYGYSSGYYQNPGTALNEDLRQQQAVGTQIRTQEKVRMASNVTGIMEQIKSATSTVRRNMTQKYQIEF